MADKQSFVLTGYVQRSTCGCGECSGNYFHIDGEGWGSIHLGKLHHGLEKYLDELSGAGDKGQGKAFDIKVTITVEPLGAHEHKELHRHTFSGEEYEKHLELEAKILSPSEPTDKPTELLSEDPFKSILLSANKKKPS